MDMKSGMASPRANKGVPQVPQKERVVLPPLLAVTV